MLRRYAATREAAMAAFAKSWRRRIGRVLINAQIAAPLLWHLLSNLPSHFFMEQQEWLSKKYRGS
jgi:hypothetical protein